MRLGNLLVWWAAMAVPTGTVAQSIESELDAALDFEREERYTEAAEKYRLALRRQPTNPSALLGLERVLTSAGQLNTILPQVTAALGRDQSNLLARGLELRVWSSGGQLDSLAAAARRWIAVAPGSADPYREWAYGLAQRGNYKQAQEILLEGGQRVGGAALAQDVAQLSALSGQWSQATRQWHTAVTANEALADGASSSLARAPENDRKGVLDLLQRTIGDGPARRMAADLMLVWGRPGEAWTLLDASLPQDRATAIAGLQRFADQAQLLRSAEASRARGYALEKLAGLGRGVASERARIDAARAFAEAGDRTAAERMLQRIAADSVASPQSASTAMAALITVMAEQGRVEEAEGQYREWSGRMTGEEAQNLREKLSWAWILKGDFLTAKTIIADDSSIGTLAIRGWMALFNGDLKLATKHFRAAGPHAGNRDEATRRTALAALVQRIEPDSVPEFGRALYSLTVADTATALRQLMEAADSLPKEGGRADVWYFAGRLAAAHREPNVAQRALQAAIASHPVGPVAAPAEFALAESYAQAGQAARATEHLEHLILTYPQSAMVPQARRLLDQVKGKIPRS